MRFNLEVSNQSVTIEHHIKAAMYQKLHDAAIITGWVRITGPVVGVVSGLLTIATRIAVMIENIIKGLANILGCPFVKGCKLGRGLKLLLVGAPANFIVLPFSCLSAALGLVGKTVYIAVKPEKYTNERLRQHSMHLKNNDPDELDNQVNDLFQAEKKPVVDKPQINIEDKIQVPFKEPPPLAAQ